MVYVCKTEDEFLEDKTHWFVDLTNGERVWQDDYRPGVNPPQAWLRLGQYVKENNLNILRMCLRFRSHLEFPLPDNALGYFFSKAALAFYGENDTIQMFLIGHYDGEVVHVQAWRTPELLQEWTQVRTINSLKDKDLLILRRNT